MPVLDFSERRVGILKAGSHPLDIVLRISCGFPANTRYLSFGLPSGQGELLDLQIFLRLRKFFAIEV